MGRAKSFFITLCILTSCVAEAGLCKKWGKPRQIGRLNTKFISESSGLLASRILSDRLYHINDSGDGPHVYISRKNGQQIGKFSIANAKVDDVEALAYARCKINDCLVVADIGDNFKKRHDYKLYFIEEQKQFPKVIEPQRIVRFNYQDGAHDAEGIFFSTRGDAYIITKEISFFLRSSKPGYIFRLTSEQLHSQKNIITATQVGRVDIADDHNFFLHQVPTDLSINRAGNQLLLLNYKDVVSFSVQEDPIMGIKLKKIETIPITSLSQQESISFSSDGRSFIYTTEHVRSSKGEIIQVDCVK